MWCDAITMMTIALPLLGQTWDHTWHELTSHDNIECQSRVMMTPSQQSDPKTDIRLGPLSAATHQLWAWGQFNLIPAFQGYGKVLISKSLQVCDEKLIPEYLATTNTIFEISLSQLSPGLQIYGWLREYRSGSETLGWSSNNPQRQFKL